MKISPRRSIASGLVAAVAAGVALVAAPAAQAAPIGTLTLTPASGGAFTSITGQTSDGCPATTTSFLIRISGGNIVGTQNINGASTLSSVGATAGGPAFSVGFSKVFDTISSDNGTALTAGAYLIELVCRAGSTSVGEFTANVTVGAAGVSYAQALPASSTTIAAPVKVSPAGNPALGQTLTVSSVVTNTGAAGNGAPAGTVEFLNSASAVIATTSTAASSTATTATFQAVVPANQLVVGANSISARFVSPTSAFTASGPSASLSVSVDQALATLGNPVPSPASVDTVTGFSVLAPVTGAFGTPTGTVAYTVKDSSSTVVGTSTVNVGVSATFPAIATTGTYTIEATYSGNGTYQAVTTPTVGTVTVIPAGIQKDFLTEVITTTVPEGTLTITLKTTDPATSIPDDFVQGTDITVGNAVSNVVPLGNTALSVDAITGLPLLVASKDIIPVAVTDQRAGDFGYAVGVKVTDFAPYGAGAPTGPNAAINGQNLGLTPAFVSFNRYPTANASNYTTVAGITATTTAPAAGVLPSDPGSAGLKQEKPFFRVPARDTTTGTGGSLGTVVFGGNLQLQAPTTTIAGNYRATLTISVYAEPKAFA